MPSYLQKRRRRWYAVLEIPKDLRKHFGKSRFVESLKTESQSAAQRRVMPVITSWKMEIAEARNEPTGDDAAYWEQKLRHAKTENKRREILEQIDYAAWEIGAINVDKIGDQPSSNPEAIKFYGKATGNLVEFTKHLDEWLGSTQFTEKTQDMHRSAIKKFADKFEMIQDISRPEVRRWTTEQINENGLKPKTLQRILSGLRSYWRYLQSIDVVGEDEEPFSKLDLSRAAKKTSPADSRLPFKPKEVTELLIAAVERNESTLADLIVLGMWTGCRIEELCSLGVKSVKDDHISIRDAKTSAGWREVPIHPKLSKAFKRLVRDSKDGYVLSGLTVNKYGDRSNAIGKRFGKLKTELGFGKQHVFHSIRKTVVTILENAGVPENVVADIVGHEKTTMTYGLYSGGVSIDVKKSALKKLVY